jgi:tetratricopeptide (TPR) repeat protein
LAFHRARALFRQDRNQEALESIGIALALGEEAKLPVVPFGSFLDLHGLILLDSERLPEAIAVFERTAALYATLGEDHPFRADPLMDLGAARARVGDTAGARVALARSLTIVRQAVGAEHLEEAIALTWLADAANRDESWAEAEPYARRALAIKEASLGPDGYSVPFTLDVLAVALDHLGRGDEAGQLLERAMKLRTKLMGSAAGERARTFALLAAHHRHAGRLAEAGRAVDEALGILAGGHVPDRVDTLTNLAEVRLDQGRAADALPLLERAAAVAHPGLGQRRMRFARARADWAMGRDRPAALAEARAVLAASRADSWLGVEIRTWLAAR